MSVDSQASEWPSKECKGMEPEKNSGGEENGSVRTEQAELHLTNNPIPESDKAAESASQRESAEDENAARIWFKNLELAERLAALSFTDVPFISTLAALASWSNFGPQTDVGQTYAGSTRMELEWGSLVNLDDVDYLYTSFQPPSSSSRSVEFNAIGLMQGKETNKLEVLDDLKTIDDSTDSGGETAKADVFRIHVPRAEPVAVDKDVAVIDDNLRTFLDKVSFVFPAVLRRVSFHSEDNICPMVALSPSFAAMCNGEDLLRVLDCNATDADGPQFLSDMSGRESASVGGWMKRLRILSAARSDVPLFVVLLTRMEWAAATCYAEYCKQEAIYSCPNVQLSVGAGKVDDFGTNNQDLCGAGDGTSLDCSARRAISGCGKELQSINAWCNNIILDEKYCESAKYTFLRESEASFLSMEDCSFEDIVFVRCEWVLRYPKDLLGRIDFQSINKLVDASLRGNENAHGSQTVQDQLVAEEAKAKQLGTTEELEKDYHRQDEADEIAEFVQVSQGTSSGTKKKKRKNRKRKKKIPADRATGHSLHKQREASIDVVEVALSPPQNAIEVVPSRNENAALKQAPDAIIASDATNIDTGETEAFTSSLSPNIVAVNSEGSDIGTDFADNDGTSDPVVLPIPTDISVLCKEGVVVVAAPLATDEQGTAHCGKAVDVNVTSHHDDEDVWETVEIRTRGNRRKTFERSGSSIFRHSGHQSMGFISTSGDGAKKPKSGRPVASRKRNISRKIVKDVIHSILDSVDDEIRKRRQYNNAVPAVVNAWKIGPPGSRPSPAPLNAASSANLVNARQAPEKLEKTLRDVVVGKHVLASKKLCSPDLSISAEVCPIRAGDKSEGSGTPSVRPMISGKIGSAQRGKVGVAADQNTAPTYQETVSAVSASSNAAVESKGDVLEAEDPESKSVSSSGNTDDAPQNIARVDAAPVWKDGLPAPPLPTLLSPENAYSANSSVASSLEASHAGHRYHHSTSAADGNDVGYHLLDVCDRLSRDMGLFMSRRTLALNSRRQERAALLAALQDSVSSIWPGRCHVEMYGSCATQLDLPSSDLDVVILGLDHTSDLVITPQSPATPHNVASSKSMSRESNAAGSSGGDSDGQEKPPVSAFQHSITAAPFIPMIQRNAERVVRLARKLESQPWAVQVNAIPTASVPVIKVLADPSKLDRKTHRDDWFGHSHIGTDDSAGPTVRVLGDGIGERGFSKQPFLQQTLLPWRGSDVVNGLLKLDITFEGPEHGGIGSTKFSSHVVAEVCHESGLYPEATPFVQVLMVLKELLAQRKLNEPYSGGLSSYALLLLVLALMRERSVIREEIERVERQRRAMNSGDPNNGFTGSFNALAPPFENGAMTAKVTTLADISANAKFANPGQGPVQGRSDGSQGNGGQNKSAKGHVGNNHRKKGAPKVAEISSPISPKDSYTSKASSSWASITKKSSAARDLSQEQTQKTSTDPKTYRNPYPANIQGAKQGQKPASFADAVARSNPVAAASRFRVPHGVVSKQGTARYQSNDEAASMNSTKSSPSALSNRVSHETNAKKDISTSLLDPSYDCSAPNVTPSTASMDSSSLANTLSYYPQGFNDVIEVLCSGETTAGKLLMHFLLYYGEHFDSQTMAIDLSGKHERDFTVHSPSYSYLSPYIPRRAPGRIDPITGMLTVDPIVIYDPLEGAENNNVARRCFCWSSVRWIFAQSYTTLSSAVERSATPPTTPGGTAQGKVSYGFSVTRSGSLSGRDTTVVPAVAASVSLSSSFDLAPSYQGDSVVAGDLMDPSSPLLRCLLSF